MKPYRLYYHESVWSALRKFGKGEQKVVLAIGRDLADNPFQPADYIEPDDTGCAWSCLLRNGWAVIYYPDHAVREVKIGQIRRADR